MKILGWWNNSYVHIYITNIYKILTLTDSQHFLKNKSENDGEKNQQQWRNKYHTLQISERKSKNTQPVASLSADSYVS